MDNFFKVTCKDILLEMQDTSWFVKRESFYQEELNNSKDKEGKSNKKVSFDKIKQDNQKLKEKFEGLATYFKKAGEEDIKKTNEDDIANKVTIRKEVFQAIKNFNKFDREVITYINRMCDCIYEKDIGKMDFLKMSDRQYRDIRQKIDFDTDFLIDLRYNSAKENNRNTIIITKKKAFSLSLELDNKYEDTMRRISREIEESWSRYLKLTVLSATLGIAFSVLTLGIGIPLYLYMFSSYWFKALRTIIQVKKFRRSYKERYNFIKMLLKG